MRGGLRGFRTRQGPPHRASARGPGRLAQRQRGHGHGERRGDGGGPEDPADRPRGRPHERDGEEGSGHRPHGVRRLAQPERCALPCGRRDLGRQGVTRRPSEALAEPAHEATAATPPMVLARGNTGLVAAARPWPARARSFGRPRRSLRAPEITVVAEAVALGNPFTGPAPRPACRAPPHEERQRRVDHLGRDVHQEGREAERPDAPGTARSWLGRGGGALCVRPAMPPPRCRRRHGGANA